MSTSLRRKSRIALGAGVSLTALVLAVPAVAADKVLKAPAPAADRGEFRWFVEGARSGPTAMQFRIRRAGSSS
jgi:hypothetical protein